MTTVGEKIIQQSPSWEVKMIERDDEGLSFYLNHYRPFRLKMLRECPSAFSSTLAREEAFDPPRWKQRALEPVARTFVAVENADGRHCTVISSLTLLGPFAVDETERLNLFTENRPGSKNIKEIAASVERWGIAAVFTDPKFRRLGLGSEVLAAATRYAVKESEARGSDCLLTLGLMPGNADARAFYERAGFRLCHPNPGNSSGGEVDLARYVVAGKRFQ